MGRAPDLYTGLRYRQDFWPLNGSKQPGEMLRAIAAERYVNCQVVLHLAYELAWGILLPGYLRSQELWQDTEHTKFLPVSQTREGSIQCQEPWQEGDIFFFAYPRTLGDPMCYHLAVLWDFDKGDGHPRLLHSVKFKQRSDAVVTCPLWKFEQRNHRVLMGVKRLLPEAKEELKVPFQLQIADAW